MTVPLAGFVMEAAPRRFACGCIKQVTNTDIHLWKITNANLLHLAKTAARGENKQVFGVKPQATIFNPH
jgi:hypothetical protein